jgi:hypothetical protein
MEEERKNNKSFISKGKKEDVYHVLYKLPYGDSPYVRAKHAQVYHYLYFYLTNIFGINSLVSRSFL